MGTNICSAATRSAHNDKYPWNYLQRTRNDVGFQGQRYNIDNDTAYHTLSLPQWPVVDFAKIQFNKY